tara:strand:+ start:164 stop:940 length:777 start_codon:yes stop_codon:yes gene_type:complete
MSANILGNLLVWGLISGTLLSYLPQYIKIYNTKSVRGISESTIVMGIYSCMFNIIGTIQEDYQSLIHCRQNNDCYSKIIPIIQLISPGLCFTILYLFYIYYNIHTEDQILLTGEQKYATRRAWYNLYANITIITIFILTSINLKYQYINTIGKIFNITSMILSLVMWLPQIYTTYKLKSDHALSLIALSIHAFGCLITIIYQYAIAKQSFLVILNYLVGGISEASIVLIVYYYRNKNKSKYHEYPKPMYNPDSKYTTL